MILADIATFLQESLPISDLVGERIYAEVAPEGAEWPRLVLSGDDDSPEYALTGEAGATMADVEVNCWAKDPWQASRLSDAVRNRLSGYRGTAGDATIRSAVITSNIAANEPPKNGSGGWKYRQIMRFEIIYLSSIPTGT